MITIGTIVIVARMATTLTWISYDIVKRLVKKQTTAPDRLNEEKDRRRQRQSIEVLLGLAPSLIAAGEQNYKEQNAPSLVKIQAAKFPFVGDGFDDAVSDFERTLQRSKHKLSHNLPDVTAVSASGSATVLPTPSQNGPRQDFESATIELSGMSPLALQNIREQMALSLERTKQLEDQVKMLPELKAQISSLQEENHRLQLRLKSEETVRLNILNSNFIQPQYSRQRSQSFTNIDNVDNSSKKETSPPPPPPRKDFGVMCGVLTRTVGVGHQSPNMRHVSTHTFDSDLADKWLLEKNKFLNFDNAANYIKKVTISKETQTLIPKEKRDVGLQFVYEVPRIPTIQRACQTNEVMKHVNHVGILAKSKSSNVSIQKTVDSATVGCSEDSITDIFCKKCNVFKTSVAVGPANNEDVHISPISLALLSSRSKSFNLGEDRLNLNTRTRTVALQYEPNNITRGCQVDIKVKSLNKACQSEIKLLDKNTQYHNFSVSVYTDTQNLILPKKQKHVACEAKEMKCDTNDVGCNTAVELSRCAKCDKEKEEVKDGIKKDGGSPTPSRIPRPQIPTTPVEIRKFRRQDTYTKIYSPTDKFAPPSQSLRLSGLDLSPKSISNETSPLDKVKQNFKLEIPHAQNGVNSGPITKVQIQEITLPVSEPTILQTIAQKERNKVVPSKEMQGAMKVLNDALQKNTKNLKNHSAVDIVQQEWFKISSLITANPLDVEDYLDAFEEMSGLLLEYVVNMSDSSGNTAMHYAVSHGNFDVVSILLDSKVCDINKQNKAGYTSVMLVSLAEVRSQTHANVVRRLFQLADVNIRAKQHGQTALMLAVSHGRLDMVKMLLEAGADINIQDEDGSTALMCAAEHGHIEIVKHFLLQSDCDSSIIDIDGSTALKIAMEAGHRHIGVLLYAHERNLQKHHGGKVKRTKSVSPKTPSSPLPVRNSHRALTDTKK